MIKSTIINAAIKVLVKGDIEIKSFLCPSLKSPKSACRLCVDTCPADAISLTEEVIDEKKCFNCGICVSVCPAGVYSSRTESDSAIVEAAKKSAVYNSDGTMSVTFSCGMIENEEKLSVKLKCLGRLNENIILWLKRLGIRTQEYEKGECAQCKISPGYTVFKQNLRLARLIEDSLGKDCWSKFKNSTDEKNEGGNTAQKGSGFSRRDFFRAVRGKSLLKVGEIVEDLSEKEKKFDVKKKGESGKRRLLKQIVSFADDNMERVEASGGIMLPFGEAQINEFCMGCDVCAMLCPTAAIGKRTDEKKVHMEFSYERCFNCGLCTEVCLTNAISLTSVFDAGKLVSSPSYKILKSFLKGTCELCGQEFSAVNDSEQICHICRRVGKSSVQSHK